jgi:hypothetical protein
VKDLRGQVLQLGDRLDARVATAGHDERQVLRADVRLVDRLRDLEAPQQRVAQVERLEDALKPDGGVGEPGDRQVPRDGPERDDQLVVREHQLIPLDRAAPERPAVGIASHNPGDQELGVIQLLAQRHGHVLWIQRTARHCRQQRRVEKEVRLAYERDPRAVPRELPLQGAHRIQAGEAAPRHHDVPSH